MDVFGRIVDGSFEQAPKNYNNIINFNTNPVLMSQYGFKKVIADDLPDLKEHQMATSIYLEYDDKILKKWNVVDVVK